MGWLDEYVGKEYNEEGIWIEPKQQYEYILY